MAKKGLEFEGVIEDSIYPNIGIINHDGKEIRVKNAVEGTKGVFRVQRRRKGYSDAKMVEVLEDSPLFTEKPCDHFGRCGGCTYQNISYEEELKYKEKQVKNLFRDAEIDVEIEGILESPVVKGYRNKMEFTFGDEYKDGPLNLGMHRKGAFYEIETIKDCNICDNDFTDILLSVLEYFRSLNEKFYHKRTHKGFLRHLLVRKALSTGEIIINLVTSSQGEIDEEEFKSLLLNLNLKGEVVGIFHTINDNVADIIKADEIRKLYGREYIREEICGLKFNISLFSFFQTNTFAAEKLYELTSDFIGDIKGKNVFDLYSGTGTIAQIMAKDADKVYAVEIVEEAVEKARENSRLNELDNIDFRVGDVFKVVDELEIEPDLIVIDPPRPGLEKAASKIADFQSGEIVYVSCNPKTLVNDLKVFLEKGYEIKRVKLVDQFPRTPHVEAIVKIEKL